VSAPVSDDRSPVATKRRASTKRASAAQLGRRVTAEFIGTALLLIAVIGSGIAAKSLSPGDTGLELLENAAATGAALVAIILAVGSVSGAHLNPVVSGADALFRGLRLVDLAAYIVAQVLGAIVGVVIANLMFSLPAISVSTHIRSSPNLWLGEVVATFGLLPVVFGVTRGGRSAAAPFAVGAYITGAYFFTSSTSFANPAVTLARALSDTFAGIAPLSVVPFIFAQLVGAALACVIVRVLWPRADDLGRDIVVPHDAADMDAYEVKRV
jgi:glycerol uptake facilitator-like aquaporin